MLKYTVRACFVLSEAHGAFLKCPHHIAFPPAMKESSCCSSLGGSCCSSLSPAFGFVLVLNFGHSHRCVGIPCGTSEHAWAGDIRDSGWIPGWGRPPGEGTGTHSSILALEESHGQRTYKAVQSVGSQSRTRLRRLSMQ